MIKNLERIDSRYLDKLDQFYKELKEKDLNLFNLIIKVADTIHGDYIQSSTNLNFGFPEFEYIIFKLKPEISYREFREIWYESNIYLNRYENRYQVNVLNFYKSLQDHNLVPKIIE